MSISDITERYRERKCDVCDSKMRYVYEPVTEDFVGYVCMKPDCENHYTKKVYGE